MATRPDWNPLRLLTRIIRVVTWVLGIGALVLVIANVSALGWLPGTTASPVCVDTSGAGPIPDRGHVTSGGLTCVDRPSAAQRAADLGDQLPQALFTLAALVLLLRFLRAASQEGPYADTVPGTLAALGWLVLVGAPVSGLLVAVSRQVLRGSLTAGVPSTSWYADWWAAFPWWSTATGIAALTFAHILRIGVRMREDLEGTI
jgi:hypothetical protein